MQRCPFLLTFLEAVLCSSSQLWIAVLTRLADSMWQHVISRQCTSKHDLCVALEVPLSDCCRSTAAPCPVCGLPRRPHVYRKVSDSCGFWGQSVSTRRGTHTLMRPYSLSLLFTQESGKCVCERVAIWVGVCVVHMCNLCVRRGGRCISTAATSSDSDVTVRLGLCQDNAANPVLLTTTSV